MKDWKEYEVTGNSAKRFYQKIIRKKGLKIGFNVYEYEYLPHIQLPTNWELEIQIPEELSIVKNVVNVAVFPYDKLDFKRIERDGKKVLNRLIRGIK